MALLRAQFPHPFTLVTPGIRPMNAVQGDQKRIVTPKDTLLAGVDHLVIGRPITQAKDPLAALEAINRGLSAIKK